MRLSEIYDDPGEHHIDLSSKDDMFRDAPAKLSFGLFDFKILQAYQDAIYLALAEKSTGSVKTYLNLTKAEFGWQIGYMQSDTKQEGHMRFVLEQAAQLLGKFLSDQSQSKDAREFWQYVIQKPGFLIIKAYNTKSKKSYVLRFVRGKWKPDVWSGDDEWRLLIKPKFNTPKKIYESERIYSLAYSGETFNHWVGYHYLDRI